MEAEIRAEIAELQRRLAELTRRVVRPPPPGELPEGALQLLVCRLEDDPVALLLDQLDEVLPLARLAPILEAPPWILGLLNLRGVPVVVLDVYARTHGAARRPRVTDRIVVCRVGGRRVGLAFAGVEALEQLPRQALSPPPPELPLTPYVHGIVTVDARPIFVLSIPRLVESSDLPEVAT